MFTEIGASGNAERLSGERDAGELAAVREMRDVVATRVQCRGPARRSRNLDKRVMVRFPSLYRRQTAFRLGLFSPGLRLRRAFLRRALVSRGSPPAATTSSSRGSLWTGSRARPRSRRVSSA
jgi:hypothetical protein